MGSMIIVAQCVGRDREIDDLIARCDAATAPRIVQVTGAPGIGKSTMLMRAAEVHRERHGDARTLWAQASPWEAGTSGAVLRQLLQLPASVTAGDLADGLASRLDDATASLIVVDDAECMDEMSLQTLIDLTRHRRDLLALIVLASVRVPEALSGLVTDEIRLGGLDSAALAELATSRGLVIHPAMTEKLIRHTCGNPRHIAALFDEVPAGVWARNDVSLPAPRGVVADVEKRLGQCTSEVRALIESMAVLDDVEPLDTVVALAGLEEPLAAIDEALRSGLVVMDTVPTPADVRPRLADPLIRAAVLEAFGVAAVAGAHRRAAEIVADPARRLHHLVAATPVADPALADDLDRMARGRGAEGAWAEAAGLFRQAGRLTPDPLLRETRVTLAVDALLAAGDCVGAAALVPTVESLRETPLRNATLAYLAILRGRSAEARVRLDRAWSIVSIDREPEIAAFIAQRHVLHNLARCQGVDLVQWADRAIELAGSESSAGVEAAVIRGLGLAWSGHPEQARSEYADLAERIEFGAQLQRVAMGRGWLQLGLDDVGEARSNLETAVSMATLGGSDRISLWSLAWLARVHFRTGQWNEAMRIVDQGHALARSSGIQLANPLLNWTAVQVYSLRGDWERAERGIRETGSGPGDYEIMRIPELLARAQVAEARADYGKVRRILEPLTVMADDVPALADPAWWPWVDVLANALVMEGRLGEANDLLDRYETRIDAQTHRSAAARLKYARGRYQGAIGDIHAARRTFEEALTLLDGLPLRYDLARVNFAYGQTLRRAGKRRAADAVIGTARDIYSSMGATTYVQRCDRELKAGGMRSPRGERDAVGLTPQEESVASLVANGLSNREVAAELFVSPKTVQYHLTRIYAKLALRSRAELAASWREEPPDS